MALTTEISLTANQLDMILQGLQSVKPHEVENAAALVRLWNRMARERDRLHFNSQGLPYIDPAVFKN